MQFFFAWVEPTDTTFGPSHHVFDVQIKSFSLTQQEGAFATLDVVIPNPRVGLLSPGRKQWAWFSVDTQLTVYGVVPLFFGRLTAVPLGFDGELLTLSLQARPSDYDARKRAVAEALRVAPYYDPLWVAADRRDDPDAVLEFYPAAWHCDRITHEVTASDFVTGAGSSKDYDDGLIYTSVSGSIGSPPLRAVVVEGQAVWEQFARGTVNISSAIDQAFVTVGSGNGYTFNSLTGGGLSEDWPEKDDNIGEGWTVGGGTAVTRVDGVAVVQGFVTVITSNGTGQIPVWTMSQTFIAAYDVTRQRSEKVRFTLVADCQDVINVVDDEQVSYLTLASSDTDKPIDAGGLQPIRDVRHRSYFPSLRGQQSLTALISMARAQLLERARCVQFTAEVPFLASMDLNCTMNARFADPRIPGGEASGKVVAYEISLSGEDMTLRASVTIGCTVGLGNSVVAVAGTGAWVDDDWVDDDWQVQVGQFIMPISGQVIYGALTTPPNDDGIDFIGGMTQANVVSSCLVYNGAATQTATIDALGVANDLSEAAQVLNAVYTEVDLTLVPLTGGPFETIYNVDVSRLMVAKTIDLEAA